MAVTDHRRSSVSGVKLWRLCPFWKPAPPSTSSSASSTQVLTTRNGTVLVNSRSSNSVSAVAKSILPARRRLRLDPANNLYFPYEPGKQVKSAVKIKNTSRSFVAFKFQTTAPKSCYMRPPGGTLAPGQSIIATVFKFVEDPENKEKLLDQKSKLKFKIMSLRVKEGTEYVPELFDELKDQITVERILRVVFLDVEQPCPALENLNACWPKLKLHLKFERNLQQKRTPE